MLIIGCSAHEHTFETSVWDYDASFHWHPATCEHTGNRSYINHHVFESEITNPTYEEGGFVTRTCTICGYSYKDDRIEKLTYNSSQHKVASYNNKNETWDSKYEDHSYVETEIESKDDAGGYIEHKCSVCGYSYKEEKEYVISFIDYDGRICDTMYKKYGESINYTVISHHYSYVENGYKYVFDHWNPKIERVRCDQTYTAVFRQYETLQYVLKLNRDVDRYYAWIYFTVEDRVKLPALKENGKEFLGWYDDEGNKYDEIPVGTTGDMTLTAHWKIYKYQIEFNLQGGTAAAEYPTEMTVDDKLHLEKPTKSGCVFDGWSYGAPISGTNLDVIEGKKVAQFDYQSPVKIYANWKNVSNNVYTIYWRDSEDVLLKQETVSYGVTPNYDGTPKKAGGYNFYYIFAGWKEEIVPVTALESCSYTYHANFIKHVYTDGELLSLSASNIEDYLSFTIHYQYHQVYNSEYEQYVVDYVNVYYTFNSKHPDEYKFVDTSLTMSFAGETFSARLSSDGSGKRL